MTAEWYQDTIGSEKLVIGLMLYSGPDQYQAIDRAAELIDVNDFFSDAHQILFKAIQGLRAKSRSVDFLAVTDAIREADALDKWGDEDRLMFDLRDMADKSVGIYAYGLETHCEFVRLAAIKRGLHQMASDVIRGCSARQPVADITAAAERGLTAAVSRVVMQETVSLAEAMQGYEGIIEARRQVGPSGLFTGLTKLDGILGGLGPGELVILAARPSIGKTALALEMCARYARRLKVESLFVSLEMPRDQLIDRLVASTAVVGLRQIVEGEAIEGEDAERLAEAIRNVRSLPILIDDAPKRTLTQIAANARRRVREGRLGLVVIDYLQLITVENDRKRGSASRQEDVADISRRLKELARELKIPVMCLCQLNRQVEGRKDHKPQLGDLRESGGIEQDADKVILLHRPCFYNAGDRRGEADVIVAKNRNGKTATAALAYLAEIVKFDNLARGY